MVEGKRYGEGTPGAMRGVEEPSGGGGLKRELGTRERKSERERGLVAGSHGEGAGKRLGVSLGEERERERGGLCRTPIRSIAAYTVRARSRATTRSLSRYPRRHFVPYLEARWVF